MIAITFGDNLNRSVAAATPDTTIRDFIAANNFDIGSRSLTLQGVTLSEADYDKTFAQKGITGTTASLLAIARKDNAAALD